jgi:hypothetical protein
MKNLHRCKLHVAFLVALGAAGTVVLAPQAESQTRSTGDAVPSPYEGYIHAPGSPAAEAAENRLEEAEDRQLDRRARRIDDQLLRGGGICSDCD